MASVKGDLKIKIETRKHEAKVASTKQTKGGEFVWSQDRCTGCVKCARRCPVDAITIARQKVITKRLGIAPCSQACPAGVDVSRYVRLIGEGKFPEAVAVIREKIPFPSVCGYVCLHPCEAECQRRRKDEPILIRVLKRFAADHDTGFWKQNIKIAPASGKRVAIIGSGPAGLTAAYYLARLGHAVTVFETLPEAGGAVRVYIPDYRLPKDILRAEIKEIEDIGVEIRTNTKVNSIEWLFKDGYDAVLLALGAHQGIKMGVEGEDSPRVKDCITFLRELSLGKEVTLGEEVAVIGGGDSAVDAARTALRLGARKVSIIYRRTRNEMPASPEEIDEALAEGVQIDYLAAPTRINRQDGRLELESIRMELGEVDASGRRRPKPIKGSEFTQSYDTIIAAIGQQPDIPNQFNLPVGRGNTIQVDADTLATGKEGVFAAGDAVIGPSSVIEAIATGREVAISMDKYLGGSGIIEEVLAPPVEEEAVTPLREAKGGGRIKVARLPATKRLKGFEEEELGLSEKEAIKEAKRCLRCDLAYMVDEFEVDTAVCTYCGRCVDACLWDALMSGYGYEKAAKERAERVEAIEGENRVYNRVLTLLVLAVVVIVLAIVAVKLFSG